MMSEILHLIYEQSILSVSFCTLVHVQKYSIGKKIFHKQCWATIYTDITNLQRKIVLSEV